MNTVAYVLILLALFIIRGVTKGRSIAELPQDLGDLFIAVVRNDQAAVKNVLSRTGTTNDLSSTASATADLSGTGHHFADLVAFGHYVQGLAPYYKVSEHPAFGGVTPGAHVAGSDHYKGKAIDINADSAPGGEKKALDRVAALAKADGFYVLWQVPGHFDHVHVSDRR